MGFLKKIYLSIIYLTVFVSLPSQMCLIEVFFLSTLLCSLFLPVHKGMS